MRLPALQYARRTRSPPLSAEDPGERRKSIAESFPSLGAGISYADALPPPRSALSPVPIFLSLSHVLGLKSHRRHGFIIRAYTGTSPSRTPSETPTRHDCHIDIVALPSMRRPFISPS